MALNQMRKLAMWLIDNIPLGRFAPYIFKFAIGVTSWKRIDNKSIQQTTKK